MKLYSFLGIGILFILLFYYVINLNKSITEKELKLNNLTSEYNQYRDAQNKIIEAYQINSDKLQKRYQHARNIADKANSRARRHDYQKILDRKPNLFIDRANSATVKLFSDIETIANSENIDTKTANTR